MPPESEEELIRLAVEIWPDKKRVFLGPGDDCAVSAPCPPNTCLVSKVDAVVEAVHFRPEDPPSRVGHKALARAISDFAAMGAVPEVALITVGFPFHARRAGSWLKACYRGMGALAGQFSIGLAGGELTRSPRIWINVTLIGWVERNREVRRSGGRCGDMVLVTGRLGGSFPRHHLTFQPRLREGRWLARRGVTAMMDLSDGLGKDLPRLARASGCSFRVDPHQIPRRRGCGVEQAINDGEDYELLFTVDPGQAASLLEAWPFACPLHCIGELAGSDTASHTGGYLFSGWDHARTDSG